MSYPRLRPLVCVLCLCLLCVDISAHRPDHELKKWQENKFWWWSSEAPLTKALDEIPDVVRSTRIILAHFEAVERRILTNLGNRESENRDELLRPCQSPERGRWQRWPKAIRSYFGVHGFPDPDTTCITDFEGVQFTSREKPSSSVDKLYKVTLQRGLAIKQNIKAITAKFIDVETNFTNPDFMFNYAYDGRGVKCVLQPVNAVRVGDHWRIKTGIHNRPIAQGLPLFGRQKVVEYARVIDGHLGDNLHMRLSIHPGNGTERVFRDDSTTLIVTARGQAVPSLFRFNPADENPAIRQILKRARRSVRQAEMANLPSNIAILILPLVLNLIPISLVVYVSVPKMLLYMFLSDILTVIPLLLRGIELLRISGTRYRSVVTRLSSGDSSTRAEAAAGEIWAAECRISKGSRALGIVLLSLSLGFLVVGIVIELIARVVIARRNRRLRKIAQARIKSAVSEKEDSEVESSQGVGASTDTVEKDNSESTLRRRRGKQVS